MKKLFVFLLLVSTVQAHAAKFNVKGDTDIKSTIGHYRTSPAKIFCYEPVNVDGVTLAGVRRVDKEINYETATKNVEVADSLGEICKPELKEVSVGFVTNVGSYYVVLSNGNRNSPTSIDIYCHTKEFSSMCGAGDSNKVNFDKETTINVHLVD